MTKQRKLWLLPLEPLQERYTGAWYRWLPETFSHEFDVRCIDGEPLEDHVAEGAFLDINSTLFYKAHQLKHVALMFHDRLVQDGDVFFISDIEFWGMESIRYLARLQNIDVKIYGFLHAGSYIDCDYYAPMADIGQWVEPAWVQTCDGVFMGTEFHRDLFIQERLGDYPFGGLAKRLHVTGNPWRTAEARELAYNGREFREGRDIDILFPHRPDAEKQPGVFVDYMRDLERHRHLNLAFTTGRQQYRSTNDPASVTRIMQLVGEGQASVYVQLKPQDFYSVCRRSRITVSTAIEETFGYAMIEAMAQGSIPLMPHRLSYPELVNGDERFLYKNRAEFFVKLGILMGFSGEEEEKLRMEVVDLAARFDDSEEKMLEIMVNG